MWWVGLCLLLGAGWAAGELETSDPADEDEEREVIRIDFDGDGVDEYLVSTGLRNGSAGLTWVGERIVPGGRKYLGYADIQDPKGHGSYAGVSGEDFEHGMGIFTLSPAGGGEYIIVRVSLIGGVLVEEKVDEFVKHDDGKPLPEPWGSLFKDHPVVSEVVPQNELAERFPGLELVRVGDREEEAGQSGERGRDVSGRGGSGEELKEKRTAESEAGESRWVAVLIIVVLLVSGWLWVRKG